MAYSFYGGKQGRTYRLVEHYDSIQQMVELFQQGGSYNTVNYGEYVIIDTIINENHYNSPENGIIYRRGLNYTEIFNPNNLPLNDNNTISKEDKDENGNSRYYVISQDEDGNQIVDFDEDAYRSAFSAFAQNPGGGAQYVGQIVGPQGEAPELSIVEWDQFLDLYQAQTAADIKKGSLAVDPPAGVQFDDDGNAIESTLIDVIEYGYLDIKDADGNITGAYISMNIPYSTFKYHAESAEPYPDNEDGSYNDHGYAVYDQDEKVWKYTGLIAEDEISKGHPFYWQYDIKVPKGIRGQDLEQVGITHTGKMIDEDNVDQSDHNYQYYYITRNYERSAEGTTTQTYLDSWDRSIYKITDNGVIPEYQTLQRDTQYRYGDRVWANGLGDHLCLFATTSGSTSVNDLDPLFLRERGDLIQDGSITWQVIEDTVTPPSLLTIHYTHGDNDEVKIRVLDDIICDQNNGRMYVKYSDLDSLVYLGENQSIIGVDYVDTPWIDPSGMEHVIDRICIKFNTYNYDTNGRIIVNSNFSLDSDGNLIFPTTDLSGRRIQYIDEQFKFVDRIETDPITKEVTAYYNDGTETILGVLRSIGKVYIQNEGKIEEPKYLAVQFDNRLPDGSYDTDRFNDVPLNTIACFQQYGDNMIVLYSDPDARKELYQAGIDYALSNNAYTVPGYDTSLGDDDGNGNLYWINLGAIYQSNHIFGQFDSLEQLKAEYPYGFDKDTSGNLVESQKNFAGWIATIATEQTILTYAYDYNKGTGWYQLQDLSSISIKPEWTLIMSKPSENNMYKPEEDKDALLSTNGYWFVISERAD